MKDKDAKLLEEAYGTIISESKMDSLMAKVEELAFKYFDSTDDPEIGIKDFKQLVKTAYKYGLFAGEEIAHRKEFEKNVTTHNLPTSEVGKGYEG